MTSVIDRLPGCQGPAPTGPAAANPEGTPQAAGRIAGGMRFGVLGPLEVRHGAQALRTGSPQQRLVLALLLCEAGAAVPVGRLLQALWPAERPRNARKAVQVYVSNLRRMAEAVDGDPRISFDFGLSGYRIAVHPADFDLLRFEQLARDGDRRLDQGALGAGAAALKEALGLWRGPVLGEFGAVEVVRQTAQRLARRRLAVFERWVEAELALGGAQGVLDPLTELALEHPLRERLRALQMTALWQAGRMTEALAVHDEVRQGLSREFGLSPGPAIRQVHRELLADGAERTATPRHPRTPERSRPRLPPEPEDFTGRTEQVGQLSDLLAGPGAIRVVVLHGQVGAGKTALALHVGHRLRAGFPDGCVLVRLRGEDGAARPLGSVLAELWQTTGLPGAVPADPESAVAIWQDQLADRRLLLLLDDARDEALARRLVPQDGASAALITARARLSALGRAARIGLSVFSVDQALDLLGRVVGAARAARDPRAAERIVRATGLLPLGVRVAADRLAGLRHLSLTDFADRLAGRGPMLDRLRVGDVSVRARLDAALADLPPETLFHLQRLSTLPLRPFTSSAAAEASGLNDDEVCDLLETLLEHGVIDAPDWAEPPRLARFALPSLMHLRLRESGE